MTDTITERPRRGAGRVAFLERLEQCRAQLESGHEQRTIYDNFGGEEVLHISYSQFNRYVIRYILKPKTGKKNDGQQKSVGQNISTSPSIGATKDQTRKQAFKHDPNSGNDRDDLI